MEDSNSYTDRLSRYLTAMANRQPDRVPFRPFAAELTATLTGRTCQQVTHDYHQAFEAVIDTCKMFQLDAIPASMVYVWTGLTQSLGLKYYGIPGIDVPAETGFQYLEPSEDDAFMKADEYDELIDNPTAFLYTKWLPRVSAKIGGKDEFDRTTAIVKATADMFEYFNAFIPHIERMKAEVQTPSAIAGIFKAPFDILADKMRGYIGLTMDMFTQPDKVLKACEALMPHLCRVGLDSSDQNGLAPIGYWMHRGCKPFVSEGVFESHYWSTVKPIIEEFARAGRQTLFYAEGDWSMHLNSFRELPDASIIYHVDKSDIFEVSKVLSDKFCLSGGVSNMVLAYGTEEETRKICTDILKTVPKNGAYIMDASAIMQNEISPANFKVMYETCMELGGYSSPSEGLGLERPLPDKSSCGVETQLLKDSKTVSVTKSWECEKKSSGISVCGDDSICKKVWDKSESYAQTFIWQILLSF